MTSRPFPLSANVSLLFPEVPLLERFAAAAAAGFEAVELWWPFPESRPSDRAVEELIAAIDASGCRLTGLNLFAGDMPAGMRGVVSHPARRGELLENVAVVGDIARRTGCRLFNALYGARLPDVPAERQDEHALEMLTAACDAVAEIGGTILLEPLSGVPGYPIRTAADALAVIAAVRERTSGDIGLLFDTYHLTANGDDPVQVAREHTADIAHVQLADFPGRGQPGTGAIDFAAVLGTLAEQGYRGLVACEYTPTVGTVESLRWIDDSPAVRLGARA